MFISPSGIFDLWGDPSFPIPFNNLNSITDTGKNFPPYNIHQLKDDSFQLDLAVAGYSQDQLSVELEENLLVIRANPKSTFGPDIKLTVKTGISNCRWVRTFKMAPGSEVLSASLKDGVLSIILALKKKSGRKETIAIK